jgi:hypothetical protein
MLNTIKLAKVNKSDSSSLSNSTTTKDDEIICEEIISENSQKSKEDIEKFMSVNFGEQNKKQQYVNLVEENQHIPPHLINNINKIKNTLTGNPEKMEKNKTLNLVPQTEKKELQQSKDGITYDEIQNKYTITENNEKYTILYSELINSILKNEIIDKNIKKFFMIVSYNSELMRYQYNIIETIFTKNLDAMVKIQNSIYDILISEDFKKHDEKYKQNLILFYYEFITFIFKMDYSNYDKDKLEKLYSHLSYRFSNILLNQIKLLKTDLNVLQNNLSEATNIQNKLEKNINKQDNSTIEYETTIEKENTNMTTNATGDTVKTQPLTTGGKPLVSIYDSLSDMSDTSSTVIEYSSDSDNSYNSSSASNNASEN